jgi:2-C-methyl-D-erythritol 2,4-cyclodiphosphate synthase
LGDIGEIFPNTDPRWKDAQSRVFVEEAMRQARARGFAVVNLDVTILAERPKLSSFRTRMVESLEAMVAAPVNVKAGTNEECDAIGRGEAIAAHAVILMARSEPAK